MKNLSKQEISHIIEDEIIVDCYDEAEVDSGWEVFLQAGLKFPFRAKCRIRRREGEEQWIKADIVGIQTKRCTYMGDFYVEAEVNGILVPVNLMNIKKVKSDETTLRTIEVWQRRFEV